MKLSIKNEKLLTIIVGILLTIIAFFPISTNIFSLTYNFADNAAYAVRLENEVKSFKNNTPYYLSSDSSSFIWEEIKIIPIAPLWENLYILIHPFFKPYVYINILVLINIFLGFYFTSEYLRSRKINIWLCILWATIFGFSSWLLTTWVWFNLVGTFFIPLFFVWLQRLQNKQNLSNYLYVLLVWLWLSLSSIYYLPFVIIILISSLLIYKKQILILLSLFIIIVSSSYYIYKIPFHLFESYWSSYDFDSVYKVNSLKTSRDPIELVMPNRQNLFTGVMQEGMSESLSQNVPKNRLKTSMHIPIFIIILFLGVVISLFRKNNETPKKDIKFLLCVFFLASLLWLWDEIHIFWFNTQVNGLLHYIKMLPNGWVIRKSSYFLFLMVFCIATIVAIWFPRHIKNKSIITFALIIWTFFSTLPILNRPYHEISAIQLPCEILNNKKILQLPNTSYSEKLYTYHLQQSNCTGTREVLYKNNAVKHVKPFYHEQFADITKLIQEAKGEHINSLHLDFIIIYKKSITYFFDFEDTGWYFNKANLSVSWLKNSQKITETDDFVIYEIR